MRGARDPVYELRFAKRYLTGCPTRQRFRIVLPLLFTISLVVGRVEPFDDYNLLGFALNCYSGATVYLVPVEKRPFLPNFCVGLKF